MINDYAEIYLSPLVLSLEEKFPDEKLGALLESSDLSQVSPLVDFL